MTIDEAIKHAEEVAKEQEKLYKLCPVTDYGCKGDKCCKSMSYDYDGCLECAEEHRQLAEWLRDYKRLKEQQPSGDAVSRQAVLNLINADWKYEGLEEPVSSLPSVKSQEPKTGHWINVEDRTDWYDATYKCSCCGREIITPYDLKNNLYSDYPYCHCGAKMIKSQESEEV